MDRITFNPKQCGGRPCIRGMRIRVLDVLSLLAAGVPEKEILEDYPDLEAVDRRSHPSALRHKLDRRRTHSRKLADEPRSFPASGLIIISVVALCYDIYDPKLSMRSAA